MVQSSLKQTQLKTLNLSATGNKLALRKSSKKISKKDKVAAPAPLNMTQNKKQMDSEVSQTSSLEQILNWEMASAEQNQ